MKKLSKITLAKAYDVLSESEMKNIVGGMGSESESGANLTLFTCYEKWTKDDGTIKEREVGKYLSTSAEAAHSGFCINSTIADCKNAVYCK